MRASCLRDRLGYALIAFFLMVLVSNARASAAISVNGAKYLSLKSVAGQLGMQRKWVVSDERLTLKSQWTHMEFGVNDRYITINGFKVFLGYPIAFRNGDLYLGELDYDQTIAPILTPQIFQGVPKLYHIVLDAGHGGRDPGSQNRRAGLQEKILVLDISKRLGSILRKRGYRVTYTRSADHFLELSERARLANQSKADLFLSIHLNGAESSAVRGSETYVFTPLGQPSTRNARVRSSDRKRHPANRNNVWSTLAGYYVQRELVKSLNTADRGLKRARFGVLRPLNCPGLLIEAGFVTNSGEARKLKRAVYRQRIAQAIADGVFVYQKTINRLRGRGASMNTVNETAY